MTRDEILGLVDRWQRAIAQRDAAGHATLYADTASLDSPIAGSVVGRDAILRVSNAFFAAFPDASFTAGPPLVDGHRVSVLASVAGTHFGGFMGLEASGKAFRFEIAFVLEVRDGQIVTERRVYDFTGLLVQIGVLKAKPA